MAKGQLGVHGKEIAESQAPPCFNRRKIRGPWQRVDLKKVFFFGGSGALLYTLALLFLGS